MAHRDLVYPLPFGVASILAPSAPNTEGNYTYEFFTDPVSGSEIKELVVAEQVAGQWQGLSILQLVSHLVFLCTPTSMMLTQLEHTLTPLASMMPISVVTSLTITHPNHGGDHNGTQGLRFALDATQAGALSSTAWSRKLHL